VVTTTNVVGTSSNAVRIVGDVRGADIGPFWDVLVAAVTQGGKRVVLDLSELGSWSLVAQAMVLHVDRRLRPHGRHLVLLAPSAQLRAQSDRLDVFGVVETRPAAVGGIGSRRRLPGSD
jgi:ABC-type transporter Mla MlaB component